MAVIDKGIQTRARIKPSLIKIDTITGALQVSSDFTRMTCEELTNLSVSGTLNIPDRNFSVPIRRDDGRLFLFPAVVKDGRFTITINFPTTGQFQYSNDECNIDLPYKMFAINTLRIDTLRKIEV